MIRVGIVGVTGYGGRELIRLLTTGFDEISCHKRHVFHIQGCKRTEKKLLCSGAEQRIKLLVSFVDESNYISIKLKRKISLI